MCNVHSSEVTLRASADRIPSFCTLSSRLLFPFACIRCDDSEILAHRTSFAGYSECVRAQSPRSCCNPSDYFLCIESVTRTVNTTNSQIMITSASVLHGLVRTGNDKVPVPSNAIPNCQDVWICITRVYLHVVFG
ncbi:hypothetical protein M413DRAFT_288916 [Hebeloma cylindrosporum]|uniref:Uncharacterized protein n=1 Tax=Hebeloma cylindrosporum TaxID=76867 RepID=A0A0C3BIN0_HEBCY|nr:hypothetical protein M413DRAFT_288916 [Hebeloma cylindrosporum h7]